MEEALLAIHDTRILVHRAPGKGRTVQALVLSRKAKSLLDHRLLQPPGILDGHEAGGDQGSQGVGVGQRHLSGLSWPASLQCWLFSVFYEMKKMSIFALSIK